MAIAATPPAGDTQGLPPVRSGPWQRVVWVDKAVTHQCASHTESARQKSF